MTDLDSVASTPSGEAPVRDRRAGLRQWLATAKRPAGLILAVQLGLGLLIGLIWTNWAPRTTSFVVPTDDPNRSTIIPGSNEDQIAGDGRFFLLAAIAGVLIGLLAWRLRALRGPAAPLVLAAGGLLGSAVAMWLGTSLSSGQSSGPPRSTLHPPVHLHALSLLWLMPFVSVLLYVLIAGMSSDPQLQSSDQPAPANWEAPPGAASPPWPGSPAAE